MDPSLVVSFPEGASLASNGDEKPAINTPYGHLTLGALSPSVRGALDQLLHPGQSFGRLSEQVHRQGVAGDVAQLSYCLHHLATRGLLLISADAAGKRWATLAPTSPTFTIAQQELTTAPYVLSRFAYLRRLDGTVVLESPLTAARVVVHEPAVGQLLCALARPTTLADLDMLTPALPTAVAEQVLRLLLAGRMITECTDRKTTAEDKQPSLQPWEFHDLLFHARSREGRSGEILGTTYSFGRRPEPLPIVKPVAAETTIDLYRPDLDALERTDPPLARVMEQRRSIRQFGPDPMTVDQLGEFLYRVARIRDVFTIDVDTPWGHVAMEATSRPYPAGGSLYPLEFYAVVQSCRGLEPGVYHYDPLGHRLGRVCGQTRDVDHLLDETAIAIAEPRDTLQVLLVLTARFDRVMWKYAGFAYALILKDLGIVFQSMYLAATAMGLAPCAIGAGNSDRFTRILGTDYYAETSIGEFTLGSLPTVSHP